MKRIGTSDLEIFPLGLGGNVFGGSLDAFVDGGSRRGCDSPGRTASPCRSRSSRSTTSWRGAGTRSRSRRSPSVTSWASSPTSGWPAVSSPGSIARPRTSRSRGAAIATVALAWLLAKPTITAPLASASSPSQLAELLAAPALELTDGEVAALDEASRPFA